jgi:tetratricopeptide (TPR) repeat protein
VTDTAWDRLASHLDWSKGPTVSFVFADDAGAVTRLRDRAVGLVEQRGAKSRILRPATPLALREVVRELLSSRRKLDLVWLEALGDGRAWADAWNDVLVRLNERRERLRKALSGSLVLVAPVSLKARFRESAPDLWSIRALVLELPKPDPPQAQAPRGSTTRQNGYLIAEALLRWQFHSRMHRDPWFALVVSDDPAARRRLLDALTGRGARVLVHAGPTEALALPTDADLHWVMVDDDPPVGLIATLAGEGQPLSRPAILEGTPALEQILARRLPDLYATMAFVVKLAPERTFHPSPLPTLDRAEVLVRNASNALDRARTLEGSRGRGVGKARSERVRELLRAVEALLQQGWSMEALPLLGDLALASDALRPTDPDAAWLRAESEEVAGKVAQHQGDPTEALVRYQAALPIRRRLARGRGEQRFRWRAQLARCLSTIGELSLKVGDLDGAEEALREALAIRRRLVRVSDDRETLSELGMAWSVLGDLALARYESDGGPLVAATDAYREALRLRERIAREEDTPRFRRLLSVSMGRFGRLLARTGEWAEALDAFEKAAELVAELLRDDPENVNLRNEVAVTTGMIGDALRGLGRLDEAAAAYHDSAELRARLLQTDPESFKLQESLAVGLGRVAEISLLRGELDEADRASARSLELSEHLAWVAPGQPKIRAELVSAHLRRGDVLRALGRLEAGAAWSDARRELQPLTEMGPDGRRRARELEAALDARGA